MTTPPPPPPEPAPPAPAIVDYLYRVYCVKEEMPPLEKLLARLTSGNPHNPPGSFIFPPGRGLRRLQDALGASADYFVMGYLKDEAPDLFKDLEAAIPEQARGFEEGDRLIVRDARLCVVLRAQIRSPENNEFVETLVHLADAFRDLDTGVVWDVRMGKIFGHDEWRRRVMEEPFSVLNHVSVRAVPSPEGKPGKRLRTYGLKKFGSPDLLVEGVPDDLADAVAGMLRDVAEHLTQGDLLGPDEVVDYGIGKFRVVAIPPIEPEGNDLLVLVDEDESGAPVPATAGLAKLLAALRADRADKEGKRAEGGRGAE